MPTTAGRLPCISRPAAYAIRFAAAASTVTAAPATTARGRSPWASGFRSARTAALRASERETRGCGGLTGAAGSRRLRLRLPMDAELLGGCAGIVRVSYGTHHGDPLGADLARTLRVDAADGEPRLLRVLLRIANEFHSHGFESRLRR